LVKVTLHHTEPGLDDTEDLVFKQSVTGPLTWKMPFKDKTQKSYSWRAEYFKADGSHKGTGADSVTDETLVLPATAG
jgi:hypothetical protein